MKVLELQLKRPKRPVFYTPGSPHPQYIPAFFNDLFEGGKEWPPSY